MLERIEVLNPTFQMLASSTRSYDAADQLSTVTLQAGAHWHNRGRVGSVTTQLGAMLCRSASTTPSGASAPSATGQPTDTRKGRMWYDLGMKDWVFKIDQSTGKEIAERMVQIGTVQPSARTAAAKARDLAHDKMAAMIKAIDDGYSPGGVLTKVTKGPVVEPPNPLKSHYVFNTGSNDR